MHSVEMMRASIMLETWNHRTRVTYSDDDAFYLCMRQVECRSADKARVSGFCGNQSVRHFRYPFVVPRVFRISDLIPFKVSAIRKRPSQYASHLKPAAVHRVTG